MTNRPPKIDPRLREILEASGVPWQLVPKRRHVALRVGGQQVVVLPRGKPKDGGNSHSHANAIAAIRRRIREMTT